MRTCVFVRSNAERERAGELFLVGLNDGEISRRTGIPRTTVRDWRSGKLADRGSGPFCGDCGEATHGFQAVPAAAYCYVLGQYLGDGHVVYGDSTPRLRIFMDLLHMNVAERCREAIRDVLGGAHVAFATPRKDRLLVVSSYSRAWPCLLPQCGPGRKQDRRIELAAWQDALVAQAPEQLVRGLLHSDGWRGTNRVRTNGKQYAYPRYQFSQVSLDIQRIFTDGLDALGVNWRQMGPRNISVARRGDVARLDAFVERKS